MRTFLEYLLDRTPRLDARPGVYGAFHIVSLSLVLGTFVLLVLLRRRLPRGERALRTSLVVFGVGLLLLEIGKQITYSYDPGTGWAYDWSRFPFQFCSSPIYAALIAMCLPDNRVRQTLICFLGTYSPVAGCAVLFWPSSDVFSPILFLDVHTMLWHGVMLLYGLYLWLSGAIRPEWKTALRAFLVFLPLNFAALALNEAEYALDFAGDAAFNMFYTGRLGHCGIPVLSAVQQHAPYPVFFASYVLLLGTGGLAVTAAMILIDRVTARVKGSGKGSDAG